MCIRDRDMTAEMVFCQNQAVNGLLQEYASRARQDGVEFTARVDLTAHVDVYKRQLYHYCEIARELTLRDEWKVGRVIARPYTGMKKGEFRRTSNRHDYALKPYGRTALNALKDCLLYTSRCV